MKVDEKETEAATAERAAEKSIKEELPKPFEFKADRPFLFFVLDKASGLVLFMGRVAESWPLWEGPSSGAMALRGSC